MHLVHDLFQLATVTHSIGRALSFAFGMFWEVLWALILGFFLSAAVQAVVRKSEMRRLMGDDSPRSIAIATGLGAASSSCSYAAVALARSLFRRGATFTSAMAFEFASTNLVIELGILLAVLCLAFPLQPRRRSADPPPSRLPELDAVTVPTLVVQGERDPFGMPPPSANRIVARVPGDHSLRTDLEAVAAAVQSWIEQLVHQKLKELMKSK